MQQDQPVWLRLLGQVVLAQSTLGRRNDPPGGPAPGLAPRARSIHSVHFLQEGHLNYSRKWFRICSSAEAFLPSSGS